MIYKAIIADDEKMALSRLRRLLTEHFPEIEVAAEASDGITALQLIETHKPHLVFLDIEMPGATGIGVVQSAKHKPFVVFITAYGHYALPAFKTLAVDFILKPVTEDQLAVAIEKFKRMSAPTDYSGLIAGLADELKERDKNRLTITVGDSIKFVPYEKIICFEADKKYTTIFTTDTTYVTEKSLAELEELLPRDIFLRIHRKHIVNTNYIDEVKRWFDRKLKVVLNVPFSRELIVSRNYVDKVRNF